jgi:serine phosphatase RsbU (regulator of sigma subunit)
MLNPGMRDRAGASERARTLPPSHEPTALREEPRRILLVEDDDGDAVIVSELLLGVWPGLDLIRARDIREAERALEQPVDCVVLDLGLPDATGIEALRRVRARAHTLPVVVLTGDADEDRGAAALGVGAQDYLVKGSINVAGLSRAIRHSVQRKLAERFERELAILRVQSAENVRVQRGLVPRPLVDDPRLRIQSSYRPGNRRLVMGGDFFDAVQSTPTRLEVVLGDVCGHGPDEAALGVQLRIAWRTLILAGVRQAQLLGILDRLLVQERHSDHLFTTLASLSIDLDDGVASVVLAGHPPPIVATEGLPRLITEHPSGPPLGLAPEGDPVSYEFRRVELGPSWSLLLYSDGLYEGHLAAEGGRLDIDGLLRVIAAEPGMARYVAHPEALIDRVEELNAGPLEDDVAILALSCSGG